jgi:hypothetical protein
MKNILYLLTAGALLFYYSTANNICLSKKSNECYQSRRVDNQTQISGSIRCRRKDSPQTQSSFFGTSLGKNLGFGISVLNDQTFIENKHWDRLVLFSTTK